MNCSLCNHRLFGSGCQLTGKRVTDHEYCNKWEPIKNESIHDKPAIEQYRQHGLILDLGETA